MKNYFLSHVFDKDGAPGAAAPGAPAGDPPGDPPAGDPAPAAPGKAADKDPAAPKPPRERSREDIVNDKFAELTRRRTEAQNRAESEKARADKAEAELTAARALLARQAPADPDPAADPAAPARKPPPFRPVTEGRSVEDILNSEEGRAAIARQAAIDRETKEIQDRGDEIYENMVSQFGEAKVSRALNNFKIFDTGQGGLKRELLEAVYELGEDAGAVMMEIAKDERVIEKLYKLTPTQMGARVAALATTIKKPPMSKLGEPPGEMGGRGSPGATDIANKDIPMSEYVRAREEHIKRNNIRGL